MASSNHNGTNAPSQTYATIYDLPVEILQSIAELLRPGKQLKFALLGRFFSHILVCRLVPNALEQGFFHVFAWGCRRGRVDIIARCLKFGLRAQLRGTLRDNIDTTSLMGCKLGTSGLSVLPIDLALLSGNVDAVYLLLENGAVSSVPWLFVRHGPTMQLMLSYFGGGTGFAWNYVHFLVDNSADVACIDLAVRRICGIKETSLRSVTTGQHICLFSAGNDAKRACLWELMGHALGLGCNKCARTIFGDIRRGIGSSSSQDPAPCVCLFRNAAQQSSVSPATLSNLLASGLLDLRKKDAWLLLREVVRELRSLPDCSKEKWEILARYDRPPFMRPPIELTAKENIQATVQEILTSQAISQKDFRRTTERRLQVVLLEILMSEDMSRGTLCQTAAVVEKLAARASDFSSKKVCEESGFLLHVACQISRLPQEESYDSWRNPDDELRKAYKQDVELRLENILRIVRALLKGSNIYAKDHHGMTALGYARLSGIDSYLTHDFDAARHQWAENKLRSKK